MSRVVHNAQRGNVKNGFGIVGFKKSIYQNAGMVNRPVELLKI